MMKGHAKRNRTENPLTKFEKDLYQKLNGIDSATQNCYKVLNYHLTDCARKRKYSVCSSLGKTFSTFAAIKEPKTDTGDFLFNEDTMKKMKSDLKKMPVQGSKNGRGFLKTSRSYHQEGNRNYHQYNNNSNFNSNDRFQSSRKNQNNFNNNRHWNNRNNSNRGGRGHYNRKRR